MKQTSLRLSGERKSFPWKNLLLLYAVGVLLRFLVGLLTSQNPFVMPDEVLYANLARALANGDGITIRNQPITYTNLLYSALIAPIYAVSAPGGQFRLIQLFNALAMNLAIFPLYRITRRFTDNKKHIWLILVIAVMLPDMLLTTRVMTEAIVYPIFLLTMMLMFGSIAAEEMTDRGAILTAGAAFLLMQTKSIMASLILVFVGLLAFDLFLAYKKSLAAPGDPGTVRIRIRYLLIFIGSLACLLLLSRIVFQFFLKINYAVPSLYLSDFQMPTLELLKKIAPGFLLYLFFVPVAMGIFPLLLPVSNLPAYPAVQRRQILLAVLAMGLAIASACYLIFYKETIGNFYQGRIHIRYVFMYLPLLLAFVLAPPLDNRKPNGLLVGYLGFMLAMTVTVSFAALLSNRQYPVDAISLSYIIYDDPIMNMDQLAQIAMITFVGIMLWLMRKGWNKKAAGFMTLCLCLGLAAGNFFGYDMNRHNNSAAMAADARTSAEQLVQKTALLVPDDDIYFSNSLSVLDCAMTQAPYMIKLEDLCAGLGDYGQLVPLLPPQYWTEQPIVPIPVVDHVVMDSHAFNRVVLAAGTQVQASANGIYGMVSLPPDQRLFHSALTGVQYDGLPGARACLYIFDPQLLAGGQVTVYLQVSSPAAGQLVLTADDQSLTFNLDASSSWIRGTFTAPEGAARLAVAIRTNAGSPAILTYRVE